VRRIRQRDILGIDEEEEQTADKDNYQEINKSVGSDDNIILLVLGGSFFIIVREIKPKKVKARESCVTNAHVTRGP
jgi:hypothetical protein